MPGWLHRTLTILLGLLTAFVVTGLIESINMLVYPIPADLDPHRPENMQKLIDLMPFGAAVIVLIAWAAGSFCGAFVAVRFGRDRQFWPAWAVGTVQLLAGISMLLMARHPLWFSVIGVMEFLPAAALGGSLARRKETRP